MRFERCALANRAREIERRIASARCGGPKKSSDLRCRNRIAFFGQRAVEVGRGTQIMIAWRQ
jgi:hypothetical protein